MMEVRPWPPELLARVIKAMCPEKVCRTCGEASRPIREHMGRDRFRPDLNLAEFATRLRRLMNESDISISQLAKYLDVSERVIIFYLDQPPGSGRLPALDKWDLLSTYLPWTYEDRERLTLIAREYETPDRGNRQVKERLSGGALDGDLPKVVQTGSTDCGHDNWRLGVVLDPFGNATAEVATALDRDAIGIE